MMPKCRRRSWVAIVLLAVAIAGCGRVVCAAPARHAAIEYNRDIRPILSDTCFLCHGPDKNTRKAKLRLDIREEALKLGAIVPGQPEKSELVRRIFTTDAEDLMPPAESHKHLTAAQKETLKRWIAAGAEYQPHWAYVTPTRPEPPAVKKRKRVENDIDRFIVHNLELRGIEPSKEADRRTLLRRLSLDLTGLPPTTDELADFVADKAKDAYEKQVERLLTSPHYGERMAVPWLDTVRFTDTVGYHGDQNQRIFPYRDYVIDSFNENKPFDRFTIEQLAGDLLPDATVEQRIATGFNRLNMMTREGGAQPKEYLAKYAADRVRTVGTTWLGSTMGCAECHDHKFDPITSRDFYSMGAFFADVKQWGVYQDYKYTPNPELKNWSNDHPFPPELEVESASLQRRIEHLRREIYGLFLSTSHQIESSNALAGSQAEWEKSVSDYLAATTDGWVELKPILSKLEPPKVVTTTNVTEGVTNIVYKTNAPPPLVVGAVSAERAFRLTPGEKKEEEKIEFPLSAGRIVAFRIDRLPRSKEMGTLRISAVLNRAGKETKIRFFRAQATHYAPRYFNGEEITGILDGWRPVDDSDAEEQAGVWQADSPVETQEGDLLVVTARISTPMTARFSVSSLAAADPLQPELFEAFKTVLASPAVSRQPDERAMIAGIRLLSTGFDPIAFARFKKLQLALDKCHNGKTHTMVTVSSAPMVTRVLPRGNWQNETGEIVQPAPPHFLPPLRGMAGLSADEARPSRLDLARWLVSRENPLTARVFMNRLWKQFFGTGISAVVDDVGAQGEWPVHPELLDWLAVEFMDSEWDIKHMVKLIVMSRTYREESNLRPALQQLDPQNRWLSSQNPRRLEAEFVRDNALFVAGLINLEMGGPSVHPYQPAGYYANLQFPDRDYIADDDDQQYRRGIYMHWQRTFLHPMLANFDAPAREECTANRVVSNTPQQALTLLNDRTFVEASRVFAAQLLRAHVRSERERIDAAFQEALGRSAKEKEVASLTQFLAEQRSHYKTHEDEATALLKIGLAELPTDLEQAELAAWTQVCRVVLNLHETITRY
jgi:hypothetical protein